MSAQFECTKKSAEDFASEGPPDGGRDAWLTVLGSFLALFSTFGIVNSYGVFQSYYTMELLTDSTSSTISFIGAVQLAILYGAGPIIGKIFDARGLRIIFPLGAALSLTSLMILSICQKNQVWQFFLVQAFLFGIGNALIFTPSLAVMGHWFRRKRAFVLGIVGAGSSLGGVVFPILIQRLIPAIGFAWAVRTVAFVQLVCLVVASLLVKTRLPLEPRISFRDIIDIHGFCDPRYTLTAMGSFLYFYALFIPYFYIEDYALYNGVDPQQAKYLLAILNVMGIPARVIPGLLADSLGVLQVLVPASFLAGIAVLALWLPAQGTLLVVLFTVFYGLLSGAYVSLLPAYVATISPPEKFGSRLGCIYPFIALSCLLGPPTAGAFIPTFTVMHFRHLIIFSGALLLSGAATLGVAFALDRRQTSHHLSSTTTPKGHFDDEDVWSCSQLSRISELPTYTSNASLQHNPAR